MAPFDGLPLADSAALRSAARSGTCLAGRAPSPISRRIRCGSRRRTARRLPGADRPVPSRLAGPRRRPADAGLPRQLPVPGGLSAAGPAHRRLRVRSALAAARAGSQRGELLFAAVVGLVLPLAGRTRAPLKPPPVPSFEGGHGGYGGLWLTQGTSLGVALGARPSWPPRG